MYISLEHNLIESVTWTFLLHRYCMANKSCPIFIVCSSYISLIYYSKQQKVGESWRFRYDGSSEDLFIKGKTHIMCSTKHLKSQFVTSALELHHSFLQGLNLLHDLVDVCSSSTSIISLNKLSFGNSILKCSKNIENCEVYNIYVVTTIQYTPFTSKI